MEARPSDFEDCARFNRFEINLGAIAVATQHTLLEVLRDDGAAEALLRAAVAMARPAHGQASEEPGEADAEAEKDVAERYLGRQRDGQDDERHREEDGARRAEARPQRVAEGAADDPPRLRLLPVERGVNLLKRSELITKD